MQTKPQSYAILDLQFGSTGKGLLAGYLAKKFQPDGVVAAFGPNAGHTYIDAEKKKFVHIMMPMGALSPECRRVFIGPGAVVHPDILMTEAEALRSAGYQFDLIIHENATIVQERHREQEAVYGARIGSTQKGTGAALAEKIMRKHDGHPIVARDALKGTPLEGDVVSVTEYNDLIDRVKCLQIEGAQGFSLSCHHGFYPYTTSRDCTLPQLLSDCAVPLGHNRRIEVFGVCRTFPIRVNNKTGYSGPAYFDQEEIKWEDLGLEPELTTVTKLPRRIFTFSQEQIRQAVRMSAVNGVFMNFANYCKDFREEERIKKLIEDCGPKVLWKGYGPTQFDVSVQV